MKIVYIANVRIPTEKAHGLQIMHMAHSFAALGNEIELLIPKRFNDIKENPFSFYNIRQNFSIKKFFCIDLTLLGYVGFLVQTFTFYLSSYSYVLRSKADLIYSRDPFILFLLSLRRKNIIWEVHTKMEGFFVKKILPKLTLLVCISGGLKEYYLGKGAHPIKTIVAHDAVDIFLFNSIPDDKYLLRRELSLPFEKKIVSYVGKYKTMGMDKGVDVLLEIFTKAHRRDNTLFFLFVGINGDEISDFKKACVEHNMPSDSYSIIGHIPQSIAFRYLKASDIAVMNYPNIEHYAKFMSPLKMFEYMASGCAIISTDLPSIREVLTDKEDSILVPCGDTDAFTEAIISVSKDSVLLEKLSSSALQLVSEKYTWDKRAEYILSCI